MLYLPPKWPVSLDAPNVEAKENITNQKNSCVWKTMTHSSQGRCLTSPLELRIYLLCKSCVLPELVFLAIKEFREVPALNLGDIYILSPKQKGRLVLSLQGLFDN